MGCGMWEAGERWRFSNMLLTPPDGLKPIGGWHLVVRAHISLRTTTTTSISIEEKQSDSYQRSAGIRRHEVHDHTGTTAGRSRGGGGCHSGEDHPAGPVECAA